jgi:hypothetical protein
MGGQRNAPASLPPGKRPDTQGKVEGKVKVTLEQGTKSQRGSIGTAMIFL